MTSFDSKEIDKLKKICELYRKTKDWMLYAEEIDPDFESFIQPVNEMRHAFDHFMRLLAVKLEVREEPEEGYVKMHIEKVLGHVFRGAFDTLDKISITLRERIANEISPFSPSSINAALPEYYSKIKPDIESINKEIAEIRANKDIASICYDDIEKYSDCIERLKKYYNVILEKKPKIIEYEKLKSKSEIIKYKKSMLKETKNLTLIVATIGGALLIGTLLESYEWALIGALTILLILKFLEKNNG